MSPAPPFAIRRADAADAPVLTQLMHASRAYQGPYAAILRGYAISPQQIARDQVHLAADADGRVLGFYSLTALADAGRELELELDLMFVADAGQGTGLGARLFDHMRATARAYGARAVKIVSHPPAEGFYLRMGARRTGTILPGGRVAWPRPLLSLAIPGDA
jgi:GNAT superfamily N-acetyltransferase